MKYFALALMALLAISSVAMAEVTYNVGPGTVVVHDGVALAEGNLTSYTLTMYGFSNTAFLNIAEAVHQVYAPYTKSVLDTDFAMGGTDAAKAYDTHAIQLLPGEKLGAGTETIEEVNGRGLSAGLLGTFGAFNTVGMGTFDMGTMSVTVMGTAAPSYDFMQVVIPNDALVYLNGTLTTATGSEHLINTATLGGVVQQGGIPVGVPEPGTILMLVAGVLCLLGIRRK